MDAKELMIGDYFTLVDFNSPIRITAIYDDVVQLQENYKSEFDEEWYSETYIKDLKPIPLTDEILKKNFSSTTDWYFIGTDKFCFRIDKYKDKWDLYFGRDGKGTNLQIKISYVHELQHTLRLCGINKEIEI